MPAKSSIVRPSLNLMATQNQKTKSSNKSPLERYRNDFLEYCEVERNRSQKTIEGYAHYLRRFVEFAEAQGVTKPNKITLDLVRSFRLYLNRMQDAHGRNLKLLTQSYHVIALRSFLKYLIKRDVATLAPEKIELPKTPSREVSVLEVSEIDRMLDAAKEEKNELLRLRDSAILQTLFSSGVRISELTQTRRDTINLKRGEFTVRGKGDKLRLVFLSPDAISAIEQYLKKRGDNNPFLFVNHTPVGQNVTKQMDAQDTKKAAGLTPRSVQRMVKKYSLIAGIMRKVSPHTFRHSYATDLLRNGADIRSVQSLLGHASITTTQIYTHVTNQGLREIHRKFHNKKK